MRSVDDDTSLKDGWSREKKEPSGESQGWSKVHGCDHVVQTRLPSGSEDGK